MGKWDDETSKAQFPVPLMRQYRDHVTGFRRMDNTDFALPDSGTAPVAYVVGDEYEARFSVRDQIRYEVGWYSGGGFAGSFSSPPGTSRWAMPPGLPSGTQLGFRSHTGYSGSVMEVERWYL
jgi:hypothetical protein